MRSLTQFVFSSSSSSSTSSLRFEIRVFVFSVVCSFLDAHTDTHIEDNSKADEKQNQPYYRIMLFTQQHSCIELKARESERERTLFDVVCRGIFGTH